MINLTKTKLVATLGPATDKLLNWDAKNQVVLNQELAQKNYEDLVESGVDVFRFNMSHENFETHKFRFDELRKFNKNSIKQTGILIDTKGPEIRVCDIQTDNLDLNKIYKNDVVILESQNPNLVGNGHRFAISDVTKTYNMAQDLKVDQIIYLDDGKLLLQVTKLDVAKGIITTKALSDNYSIVKNKRINLMNTKYSIPFLSEFDKQTIIKAVEWDADFLALSFVSNKEQLIEVNSIIEETNPNSKIKVISKIETSESLENIEDIIEYSDGVMIARGDLALEIGFEKVPYWEEKILELCHYANKISIVATQMLDSLEKNFIPTRAETMDCYYAAKMLASSTMLSGESASGHNPINAVRMMKKITDEAEKMNQDSLTSIYDYVFDFEDFKFLDTILDLDLEDQVIVLENFDDEEVSLIGSLNFMSKFVILNSNRTDKTLYRNINVLNCDVETFKNQVNSKYIILNKEDLN